MQPCCVTWLKWLGEFCSYLMWNILDGLRQNGRHFADDIFKYIFLNENCYFIFKFHLKFVPKCLIDNKLTLAEILACRRSGDKPLPEPLMALSTDTYMSHLALMS